MNFENKTQPSVSIIVPVYNVEAYIDQCLSSVASQTYDGDIECIIVDDCGTDNSMNIVNNFVHKYCGPITFKIIHHKHNKGLSAARNTGIDNANGEYVYFLDSDDEIHPTTLKLLVKPLKNYKYDFVIGNYLTTGLNIKMPQLQLDEGEILKDDIFKYFLKKKWYVMAWNKLCNRNFLIKNSLNFKESLIYEDELWSFKLASSATSMYVVNDSSYIYRLRPGSIITSQNTDKRINALLTIYTETLKYINDHQIPITYALWDFLQSELLLILQEAYKSKKNFSKVYKNIRSLSLELPNNKYDNVKSMKGFVRDLHWFLPYPLSLYFEKILIYIVSQNSY